MNTKKSKSETKNKTGGKKQDNSKKKSSSKKKEDGKKGRIEQMPLKSRPKKKTNNKKDNKEAETKKKESSKKETKKKEEVQQSKKQEPKIPEEWKEPKKEEEEEKKERKSLIETLRRSISLRGAKKEEEEEEISPMNLVVTLNPLKHRDIIEYIEENISSGGRAEWVRDSIRLKMRVEEGVYGLNASEKSQQETQEMMQSVFGQFAEVMTQVMTDLKSQGGMRSRPASPSVRPSRTTRDRGTPGAPPKLKKVEGKGPSEDFRPERPALDDAIGAIVVVE
ncbi:MAG: hypothetical protein GF308_13885 [Candidatus Heimdallarchaeota archaeon]|nr:hypothetical protein [Candidatus Heimdallarchaeota archaeon]